MNNQNKTTKEQINFEYSTLKNTDLETVFEFYNWLQEYEPMSQSSFLRAWDTFNEIKSNKKGFREPQGDDFLLGTWINLKKK